MRTIKEPAKNVAKIWGCRKIEDTTYRPMKYLLTSDVDEGTLVYNIVTSEMVLLEGDEKALFESTPARYCSGMNELIERRFFVPEAFDESKSVSELRSLLKKLSSSKRVSGYTILPTTDCNARCFYCFENDYTRCTMTKETASAVVEYIASKGKLEPVEIQWFGGEPLVGKKRISEICEGLREKEIKFRSTMVSNAYLFDDELVKEAKCDWNLTSVQITLDGTETVYNETKAYIKPKDSPYKRVLNNIDMLLTNGIAVCVRLNVTAHNVEDLKKLINELDGRFGNRKGFSCYAHTVYEDVGYNPLSYDDGTRKLVDRQTIDINTRLSEMGLLGSYSQLPNLRTIHCMADNDSCRLIYPDGTIGRCENKSPLSEVGNIYDDVLKDEDYRKFEIVIDDNKCKECILYPNCINLEVCPETGQCSNDRIIWRLIHYKKMMTNIYNRKQQNNTINDKVQADCKS